MKRYLAIAAAGLGVAAAGWSALWYAGRGAVDEAVELELARLAASGITVEMSAREIGGFPFGYVVKASDVTITRQDGGVLEFPTLDAVVEIGGTREVVVELPPSGRLSLPASPNAPETADTEAPAGAYALKMEDAVLTFAESAGTAPPDRKAHLRAAAITATSEPATPLPEGAKNETTLRFIGVDATLTMPPPGEDARDRLVSKIERIDYLLQDRDAAGARAADIQTTEVTLTARTMRGSAAADRRISLQTGFLAATLSNQIDTENAVASGTAVAGAPTGGSGGTVDLSAETSATIITVENGQLRATTTVDEIAGRLTPTELGATIRGGAALDRLDLALSQPVDEAAPDGAPLSLRAAAGILELDDEAWAALDPDGSLERGGAELHAELNGTMRPGLPGTFGWRGAETVDAKIFVSGLGAMVDGGVDIVFDPDGIAAGNGQIRLTNSMALIRDLLSAGLLAPSQADVAFAIAGRYMKPGSTPEELVSDLEVDRGFLMVNGEPFMPLPAMPMPRLD